MPYKNPEDKKKQLREWRKANRAQCTQQMQNWRAANPEKVKAIRKKHWDAHSEEYSAEKKKKYWDNPEFFREKVRKARADRYAEYLVRRIAKKADELGVPFNLEPVDIIVPTVCPALGIPIVVDGKGQRDDCPSIDRIEPSLGYVKGNVRIVSMKANRIKNNATVEELEKVLHYLRCENARHGESNQMGRV